MLAHFSIDVDNEREFNSICIDSRKIKDSCLYICLDNKYLDNICIDNIIVITKEKYNDKTIVIDNLEDIYISMIHYFYNDCTKKVKIIGVTGTNGKTTIAHSLYKIVNKSMYIGTLYVSYNDKVIYTNNTTPSLIDNLEYINDAIKEGIKYVFMEVSSHALVQNRVKGIDFDGAIFTNLTLDHLDYHLNMENYYKAKKILFDNLKDTSFSLINIDDEYGRRLYKEVKKTKKIKYSYFDISKSRYTPNYSKIYFLNKKLKYNLIGSFNAYNVIAIYYTLRELGFSNFRSISKIRKIKCVSGRMEKVGKNIYIDYAHTPDALLKALYELKKLTKGKLHVVFGCGGNRDVSKRYYMGKVANEYADYIYLTNDNPRNEKELDIIENILSGIENRRNVYINPNRYESIEYAIKRMNKDDILLIAGKGHEDYMIKDGIKTYYSDKESVKCILNH